MKNYYFALQIRRSGAPLVPFYGTFDQAEEYLDILASNYLDGLNIPYRRDGEHYYVCKDCGEQAEDHDECPTCGSHKMELAPLFEDQCFDLLDLSIFDTDIAGFKRLGGFA